MNISKKSLVLLTLCGIAPLASASDVTSLDSVAGGWHGYGFGTANAALYPVGTASIVASPSDDADGSLRMTGDRSRVGIGVEEGYNGAEFAGFGTLDALAKGSLLVDLFRSSASQTNDARYTIGVKLLFAGNQALTWENGNNGGDTTTDAWVTRNVGVGQWFIRSGNVNYDTPTSNHTLQEWANGAKPSENANIVGLSPTSQVLGISFVVGSGISSGPNSYIGGADHLAVNFLNGFQDNYNFRAQAVPEPSAFAAIGLGAFAMLRRRKRA